MTRDRRYFDTAGELYRAAAERIRESAAEHVREDGVFTLVLAGGKTPLPVYRLLASPPFLTVMPWSKTHLFWSDERMVPPTDPRSNYHRGHGSLIERVPVPLRNIHRIMGELSSAADAAAAYQAVLETFFGRDRSAGPPRFHLALLGIGMDGHTASLFPGETALDETETWAAPAEAPPEAEIRGRVTLTPPVLSNSEEVLFLAAGPEKQAIGEKIHDTEGPGSPYPAGRITARRRLQWYIASSSS